MSSEMTDFFISQFTFKVLTQYLPGRTGGHFQNPSE